MAPDHDVEFVLLGIALVKMFRDGARRHMRPVSFRLESNDKLKLHAKGELNHFDRLSAAEL